MNAQESKPQQLSPSGVEVRPISVDGVLECLALGIKDFRSAPKFGLFFGGVYAIGGWVLYLLLMHYDLPFLVYPMAMGFALLGPFIVTGLYDVSRRLEEGTELTWSGVLSSVKGASGRDIGWMALVLAFTFVIWMDIAALLFFGFLGFQSFEIDQILTEVFTTPAGLLFFVIGNMAGAVLALAVFSFTAVSFPLLYHREVDFVTAMVTSVRVVKESLPPMLMWGIIIAAFLMLSLLSGLIGLFVALPILGHATWHIYRRTVV